MQPPGKRKKPGCKSASACTMSARSPPGDPSRCAPEIAKPCRGPPIPLPSKTRASRALGSVSLGCKRRGIFLPAGGKILQGHFIEQGAVAAVELHAQGRETVHAANLRGKIIRFAFANAHAAKTFIGDAKGRGAFRDEADVVGIVGGRTGRPHERSVRLARGWD
jgi:hypothetical protein